MISLAVAAPIGVLAAVYLNEYAKDTWFTRIINLAVINLAGVPSIVHALFGLGAFVYAARFGYSIIAASLTLAVMTLPVIIASTREALAAVPMAFREACWNVGATRWQTIRGVVLPNSISGILTGVILQVAARRARPRPIMFTGAVHLQGRRARQPAPVLPRRPVHGALHAPVHPDHPGAQRAGGRCPTPPRSILLGSVLLVNAAGDRPAPLAPQQEALVMHPPAVPARAKIEVRGPPALRTATAR